MRLPGSRKEAEVRLGGRLGGEPGRYVYGLAFVDPALEFWHMDFPPPETYEEPSRVVPFECSLCHARQDVEQDDIEEDVYSVNGNVLRFCESCGTATPWKEADGAAVPAAVATRIEPSIVLFEGPREGAGRGPAPAANTLESRQPVFARPASPPHPPATPFSESAYSASFGLPLLRDPVCRIIPARRSKLCLRLLPELRWRMRQHRRRCRLAKNGTLPQTFQPRSGRSTRMGNASTAGGTYAYE